MSPCQVHNPRLFITASIKDYVSPPVITKNGRYIALTVGPPDESYSKNEITFHLDGVQADQKTNYISGSVPQVKTLDLTFSKVPES